MCRDEFKAQEKISAEDTLRRAGFARGQSANIAENPAMRPAMGFEEALHHLKRGRYITRLGWNGKGMFVFQGLPHVQVNHKPGPGEPVTSMDAADAFRAPYAGPCLCLMTAQKAIQVGWLATQSDMLAEDWITVE